MPHEHTWTRYPERFQYECDCGEVITKEEVRAAIGLLAPHEQITDSHLSIYAERRRVMGLKKYGTGEVLPEPDDAETPEVFSEADHTELVEELRASEPPREDS